MDRVSPNPSALTGPYRVILWLAGTCGPVRAEAVGKLPTVGFATAIHILSPPGTPARWAFRNGLTRK